MSDLLGVFASNSGVILTIVDGRSSLRATAMSGSLKTGGTVLVRWGSLYNSISRVSLLVFPIEQLLIFL